MLTIKFKTGNNKRDNAAFRFWTEYKVKFGVFPEWKGSRISGDEINIRLMLPRWQAAYEIEVNNE